MATVESREEAVARTAYLCSDTVISVQESLGTPSPSSSLLRLLAQSNTPSVISDSVPEIQYVRENNDPLLSVLDRARSGLFVSVTASADILLPSISHLYKLAAYPVVIHVALQPAHFPDYSPITSIRNVGWTFIQSRSPREAQDIAITAHALAVASGRGVIHFFAPQSSRPETPVRAPDPAVIGGILDVDHARQFRFGKIGTAGLLRPGNEQGGGAGGGTNLLVTTPTRQEKGEDITLPVQGSDASPSKYALSTASITSQTPSSPSTDRTPPSDATTAERSMPPVTSGDILAHVSRIWSRLEISLGSRYRVFEYAGPSDAQFCVLVFGTEADPFAEAARTSQPGEGGEKAGVGILTVRLFRPWIGAELLNAIPRSIKRIAVLEQISRKTTRWGPVLIDVLGSVQSGAGLLETIVGHQLGHLEPGTTSQALAAIMQNLRAASPVQNLMIGSPRTGPEGGIGAHTGKRGGSFPAAPGLETAYTKILEQLFGQRLFVANAQSSANTGVSPSISASPEFGFGSLLSRKENRTRFVTEVKNAAAAGFFATEAPRRWLSRWSLVAEDPAKAGELADDVISRLEVDGSSTAAGLLSKRGFFRKESLWLIGSDAWSYDLGSSGVHHVIASGENVNMLIIDSTPYSERASAREGAHARKKDIGLYAMNFGNVYVASVAVYSSYTQVLQALLEADAFAGPSVVLAYLPYFGESDSPLTVLQETKKAVDLGYWPLYRWNPLNESDDLPNFSLDSERVKQELKDFLSRDNRLTQLTKARPELGAGVAADLGSEIRSRQKRRARDAYNQLLEGLFGVPLTVLYASDNGNATSVAQRLGRRGRARGLKTTVMAMDDYPFEDLSTEENLILITSTAGQGEFPQNGRPFWDFVKGNPTLDLASLKYSVFGLGDSHYWPRKEDRVYYNKPAKDLDRVLGNLGAKRLADIGLGDDQDPDDYQTGYQEWEPRIWQALGVDAVDGLPEEPPPVTNEDIKLASNYLRGSIAQGLADDTTGAISAPDQQLTKFHGTYMQDDRDIRDLRKEQGLEPAYSFMIRCRLPGGVATPSQWIHMDDISTQLGNETMKLTTRQTFQFHGVVKARLKPAMQAINRALMTTLAACGDVNRNVMCSPLPPHSAYHREVYACSQKISDHLLPSTTAYHEIWLTDDKNEKVQVAGNAVQDFEPLYGPTYLPRKFKIAIAIPPHNDTDVYAHDVGLVAIRGDDGHLCGFNLLAGGGMGATHNNKKTYPQVGRSLGFVGTDQVHVACEKIMLVQRDHGDRKNRKHARLKYTIDDMGVDVFRAKVEELWGRRFEPEKPFAFDSNIDTFGWQRDEVGMNHFTLFVENGRVEDTAEFRMKTGLREIAKVHKGEFRLTPNQHLIVNNVADADLDRLKSLLAEYKLDNLHFSGLRLSSSACVAFPTCGLAMAESERYLPVLITKLEACLEENGLRQDSIVMRMTGCPNGCARPWLGEVAFVGKSYGAYNMYLGGGYHGQRLNKLYRSSIKEDEILAIMKPLLKRYSIERMEGERFGDFCIRSGIIRATREGRDFHDDVAEEESDEAS